MEINDVLKTNNGFHSNSSLQKKGVHVHQVISLVVVNGDH
jgi:hypothetical protein